MARIRREARIAIGASGGDPVEDIIHVELARPFDASESVAVARKSAEDPIVPELHLWNDNDIANLDDRAGIALDIACSASQGETPDRPFGEGISDGGIAGVAAGGGDGVNRILHGLQRLRGRG